MSRLTLNSLPVIQFSPHAGLRVPEEVADKLLIDRCDIYNDADLWADLHFDFSHPDLVAHIPEGYDSGTLCTVDMDIARVLVDANRMPVLDDNPDGAVKTETSYGNPIYRQPLAPSLRQTLFERYYLGYHRRAGTAVDQHLSEAKLMLDCHNMAQVGPTAYAYAGQPRPLLCLANGGDGEGMPLSASGTTSCSPELIRYAAQVGEELFCDIQLLEDNPAANVPTVTLNWPFRSGYILRNYSRVGSTDCTVPMLMIEVNRGLFIGNQRGDSVIRPPDLARIGEVRRRLYQLTARLVQYIIEHEQ